MKLSKYILLGGSILFFASCETVVTLDLEEPTPTLVMNTILEAKSSGEEEPVQVLLTKTIPTVGEGSSGFSSSIGNQVVENATVRIDGENVDSDFEYFSLSASGQYDSNVSIEENKTYTITAAAEGYESVSATVTVPSIVPIESITYTVLPNLDEDDFYEKIVKLEFDIQFKENLAQENYYHLRIGNVSDCIDLYNWDSQDIQLAESLYFRRGFMFNDNLLNGENVSLKFEASFYEYEYEGYYGYENCIPGETDISFRFDLKHISKEWYDYVRTVQAQNNSIDFFSEPVFVSTNVENGWGVVGAQATDEKTVIIEE